MASTSTARDNPAKYAAEPGAPAGLWRYRDLLPQVPSVTLGEGWTPLLHSRRYPGLWIKDEGRNPTGSTYARALSVAVSVALHEGVESVTYLGLASSTLAAYAAAAGLSAHVYLPRDPDFSTRVQAAAYGAEIHLTDDPARALAEQLAAEKGWRDLSAPEGLEGAKTLGYEICEQLGWQSPDAIIAPAELHPALLAAFDGLAQTSWTTQPPSRLFSCDLAQASALTHEGLLLSPEGAAGMATYEHLLAAGALTATQRVVLIDPGTPADSTDRLAKALGLRRLVKLPWSMPVGGIITPV